MNELNGCFLTGALIAIGGYIVVMYFRDYSFWFLVAMLIVVIGPQIAVPWWLDRKKTASYGQRERSSA